MEKGGRRFRGPSDEERDAIQQRELSELAKQIQMTEDQQRRMRASQEGGRRTLLFNNNVLGVKPNQPAASMGTRG